MPRVVTGRRGLVDAPARGWAVGPSAKDLLMNRRIALTGLPGLGFGLAAVTLVVCALVSCAAGYARARAGQQVASAVLTHQPVGTAHLTWSRSTRALTVTAQLTGLTPSSRHPAHIHTGACSAPGTVIYPLNDVVANAAGEGTSTTTIGQVADGIPASGWSVLVHNGPAMSPAVQAKPIACADVRPAPATRPATQAVTSAMKGTGAADQHAAGSASLVLRDATLTVTVTAQHLAPGSSHPQHIHAGSCQRQTPGTIVYMLEPLVADRDGNARSATVIHEVATLPPSGWYLNVHRAGALTEPWNFDPILCGNIVTK
jgi:hypothetical protein